MDISMNKNCFAYKSEDYYEGCEILKKKNCTNCRFFKTHKQVAEEKEKTIKRLLTLPEIKRKDIVDVYNCYRPSELDLTRLAAENFYKQINSKSEKE